MRSAMSLARVSDDDEPGSIDAGAARIPLRKDGRVHRVLVILGE